MRRRYVRIDLLETHDLLAGVTPKTIGLFATANIAGLILFAVGAANNGQGTDGTEFILNGSAAVGQFFYLTNEFPGFKKFFGFDLDFTAGAAKINNDNAIELFFDTDGDGISSANPPVTDAVFGDINTDRSGTTWDYLDGSAYHVNSTNPGSSACTLCNHTFSGINV